MGHKERMKEEVEKLLSLNNETFDKVRDLSRLFYNDEVSEYCFNEIVSKMKEKSKKSEFKFLGGYKIILDVSCEYVVPLYFLS